MSNRRERSTLEQQSVIAWMRNGEGYAEAKARLDAEWKRGQHPSQLAKQQRAGRPVYA